MMVDFAGFKEIIDALDGVDINAEKRFTSIHPPFRKFEQGMQRMDGETALDYSRQRKQFADGDFARIRHQQQVIKAILDKAVVRRHRHQPRQAQLLRQGDLERRGGGREDVARRHGDTAAGRPRP